MKNLTERLRKWDKGFKKKSMGDSLAVPFEGKLERLFKGQEVLEIGPGEGRQFEVASKLASKYTVADISMVVLKQEVYYHIPKYLITDYNKPLKPALGTKIHARKADVIHFWYVLHHVMKDELPVFAAFLSRYCKDGGAIMFNTPVTDLPEDTYTNDGVGTTRWTFEQVEKALAVEGFKPESKEKIWHDGSTGYVAVFRKGA